MDLVDDTPDLELAAHAPETRSSASSSGTASATWRVFAVTAVTNPDEAYRETVMLAEETTAA